MAILSMSLGFWALLLAAPGVARASSILYSNFGASLGYNIGVGNPAGNDFVGDNAAQGDSFSPLLDSSVDAVRIALSDFFGTNTAPVTVSLRSNSGGLPGAALESWTIDVGTLGAFGVYNAPVLLTSLVHPLLSMASLYWLTVSTSVDDSIAWNLDSTGDTHHTASSYNGGTTWFSSAATDLTPGAFQVEGPDNNAVPEPGTLVLLGSGAIALVGRGLRSVRDRRRRRSA